MERLVAASSDLEQTGRSFLTRFHQQAENQLGGECPEEEGLPIDAIVRSKADAGLSNERRLFNRCVSAGSRRNDSVCNGPSSTDSERRSIVVVTIVASLPPTCCRSIVPRLARPWLEWRARISSPSTCILPRRTCKDDRLCTVFLKLL